MLHACVDINGIEVSLCVTTGSFFHFRCPPLILDLIFIHFQMNTHNLSREIWHFPTIKTVWLNRECETELREQSTAHYQHSKETNQSAVQRGASITRLAVDKTHHFFVGGEGLHTKGWKVPSC